MHVTQQHGSYSQTSLLFQNIQITATTIRVGDRCKTLERYSLSSFLLCHLAATSFPSFCHPQTPLPQLPFLPIILYHKLTT